MDTSTPPDRLSAALFGKTRRAVLSLLYGHPDEEFYLRQIARISGAGLGAVQREIARLSQAGIVRRSVRGRHVFFQAEPSCPIFAELKSLVIKTAGLADVLRAALAPLAGHMELAVIYGSVAIGRQQRGSDVDVLIVGDASFGQVVSALGPAQQQLGREINPAVYPPEEFHAKMAAGHHFLTTVLRGDKLFLIGDERELAGLAGKRVAAGAPQQRRGDRRPAGGCRP